MSKPLESAPLPFDPLLKSHLLAWSVDPTGGEPLITVAIPHYKHRHYLELVLKSIFEQQYDNFEILVSNDSSPDDSDVAIPILLSESGRSFQYYSQPNNLGYDGNVRFCLSAARGRYILFLGNDDALAAPSSLEEVVKGLQETGWPQIAVTNFQDWNSGQLTERALDTKIIGSGTDVAIRVYRSFSFIGGLIFERVAAAQHETTRWDQSVYYQIYLASRIISAGGCFATLSAVVVRKDVRLNGETVPNYITKLRGTPWSFKPRHTGLDSVVRVAVDAILPYEPEADRSAVTRRILSKATSVLLPYWIVEYRKIGNWSSAVGVVRGFDLRNVLKEYQLKLRDRAFLWAIYLLAIPVALIVPLSLFSRIKMPLAKMVRKAQGL